MDLLLIRHAEPVKVVDADGPADPTLHERGIAQAGRLAAYLAEEPLEGLFSSFGPQKAESTPFTGEPPRTTMTAPPPGYQTPSPNYPYGIEPTQAPAKPQTLEQRLEPAR